jgi:hypothetical protein
VAPAKPNNNGEQTKRDRSGESWQWLQDVFSEATGEQ